MLDMETFCASNAGHSKYRPALTSSSFYQPTACHRTLRQNDYTLTTDFANRRSALLWQERPQPGGAENRGKLCSIALAAASFVVLVAVLSIAGLALYMGALHSDTPNHITFNCSAKLLKSDHFVGTLQEKARRYRLQLDALYQRSIVGPALVSCIFERFGNDSMIYFRLTLNKKKISRHVTNLEKTLKEVLLNDALSRKPIFRNVRFDPRNVFIRQTIENENAYQRATSRPKEMIKIRNDAIPRSPPRPNVTLTANVPVKNKQTVDKSNQKAPSHAQGSFKITKTEADISEKKITNVTLKPTVKTTQKPSRKTTAANETSITSAFYKIVANKNDTTLQPNQTAPTNPPIPITSVTPTPELFNMEPWIPIYPNAKVPKEPNTTLPPMITLLNQRQPVYTSFTNPGLSFHSSDTETLGSTIVKGHPIPVDKIAEITEASLWTERVNLIELESTTQEIPNNTLNTNNIENVTETQTEAETDTETIETAYVEVKTLKSSPTQMNDSFGDKQQQVIRNISTIFHSLASSLGFMPVANMTGNTTAITKTSTTIISSTSTTTPKLTTEEFVVGQGHVEVVEADEASLMLPTTKLPLVTLLPVKSNSGIRRPLRPRPSTRANSTNENEKYYAENRSFPSDSMINALSSSDTSRTKVNKSRLNDIEIKSVLNFVTEKNIPESLQEKRAKDDVEIIRHPKMEPKDNEEIKVLSMNSSMSKMRNSYVLSPEMIKQLSGISKVNGNQTEVETVLSNKAVASSYTINHAGFKILTKTFNKIPGGGKDDEEKKAFGNYNFTNKTECNNYTVKCGDGKCLPATTRCNQLLDCVGGEDEKDCNCADYLRSQFLLRKICDGIVDCWDFSDENHCEWCKPGQYVCGNSKMCIDSTQICDGLKDCPQGDDERQCVTLSPTLQSADEFQYHSEGYLLVRKNGQWGKLCVENLDNVVADTKTTWDINDLGKTVCKSMTYQDLNYIERFKENKTKTPYFEMVPVYSLKNESKSTLSFMKSSCSAGEVVKLKCDSLDCGSRPQATKHMARIVGGTNAGLGSWPWQAALYKEGEFQCGATLLSARWLLSASHCFFHSLEEHWVARLGALRRGSSLPSPYEQLRPIVKIILHPDYIDVGFINDISLLKMEFPVRFSDYVRPICLPAPGAAPKDGRLCTVVGWGQLFEEGRIFPDTLQEVQVPVISTAECRKRTIFLPLYSITDNMFCAGFERGGRDACLGDSGGPLMCPEPDGRWVLHGVTSNGYGCARSNRPGVYTAVANYITWIRSHLSNDKVAQNATFTNKSVCLGHRCPLGECLPKSRLCNGFIECSDGSDEKDCK